MSEETKLELTADQISVLKEQEKRFNEVLNVIGLQTPVDYIFLDFAQQKSRLSLKNVDNSLHFLFHTISNRDLETEERPFPFCLFVEKYISRVFDEAMQGTKEIQEMVMWSLTPSDLWKTRDILPFTDFHLYFQDVVRPLYGYSAEDLYSLLDKKKGEVFFVTHGSRSSTESQRIVALFVTTKHIIAFHFDPVDIATIKMEEKFTSKWVSFDNPISLQSLSEYAIFSRPDFNLVLSDKEIQESDAMETSKDNKTVSFATPGLDFLEDESCLGCGS